MLFGASPEGERFATELRRRLGSPADLPDWPLVSIVVLNRNGADRLRVLLSGLAHRTDYPAFELVLVDNASDDESLDIARSAEAPFPISIVANDRNETFSEGCNQGVELARGKLLLFLNNDIEPFEPGWLRELVSCLRSADAGMVGATLLQRDKPSRCAHGLRVQQRGTAIRDDAGVLRSIYRDAGADPLDDRLGVDVESVAVSGACCLISRELFDAVGGFTRGYTYGGEDTDLALEVRARGRRVVCSGRALVVHSAGSTLATVPAATRRDWTLANRRLMRERWGARARREYELDRLAGLGVWAVPADGPPPDGLTRERALAIGFCLIADDAQESPALVRTVDAIRDELIRRGHRCLAVAGPSADDSDALTYDVAVHIGGRERRTVKGSQFTVLWHTGQGAATTESEHGGYDLVFDASPEPGDARAAAADLIDATLRRMREIEFPTRIPSEYLRRAPG